jgi:hypothetical protein
MKVFIHFLIIVSISAGSARAQTVQTYNLEKEFPPFGTPPSNSASHAASRNDTLWFGTSRGLTQTADNGDAWLYFRSDDAFQPHGIYSVHLGQSAVWAATGYIKDTDVGSQQSGSGLTYSRDGGRTWTYVEQPMDDYDVDTLDYGVNKIPALGITTDAANVTYSISSLGDEVWIASFAGGVRRSNDFGLTWDRVILPPDTLDEISPGMDLRFALSPIAGQLVPEGYLNHRVFGVHVARDSSIWVGTANGVNRSTDGGSSWRKFNHQNQVNGLLGNWVIKIADQELPGGRTRIWTTNWRAEERDEIFGVSYTDNHGETWTNVLHNIRAYDFAFRDSIVYVATEEGIMRSDDNGMTWVISGSIVDPVHGHRFVIREVLSVTTASTHVWVGTSEGIARTAEFPTGRFGSDWTIYRTFTPVTGTGTTYAYPNPFSPSITSTRIHYDTDGTDGTVTIDIYNFEMRRIRSVIRDAPRIGTREHDELWDGTDDGGTIVPNGVYFYRVSVNGNDERWGKIMVLR